MQRIITDEYEIIFDKRSVTVYSTKRLVFEPKGRQIEFKRDIQSAVEQLQADLNEELFAVYGTDYNKNPVDTENALFYNVGTSSFWNSAYSAVSFDTLSPKETHLLFQELNKPQYHHYYSYKINNFLNRNIKPVLSWDKIELFPLRGVHKPFEYWKLLREHINEVIVFDNNDIKGLFGLNIHIYEPEKRFITLANPMKALLDGVICAFHRLPQTVDKEALEKVSFRLKMPAKI